MDEKLIAKEIRSAIKAGDGNKAVELITADRSRLTMETPFGSWLHVASTHGKLDIVKRLVDMGAALNARGGIAKSTPLHLAASDGHIEIVEYFLSQGAELDVSEPERNPLFAAIHGGHTAIAKMLIDAGIDTRVKYRGTSGKMKDALSYAQDWGRADIAKLIEAANAR